MFEFSIQFQKNVIFRDSNVPLLYRFPIFNLHLMRLTKDVYSTSYFRPRKSSVAECQIGSGYRIFDNGKIREVMKIVKNPCTVEHEIGYTINREHCFDWLAELI